MEHKHNNASSLLGNLRRNYGFFNKFDFQFPSRRMKTLRSKLLPGSLRLSSGDKYIFDSDPVAFGAHSEVFQISKRRKELAIKLCKVNQPQRSPYLSAERRKTRKHSAGNGCRAQPIRSVLDEIVILKRVQNNSFVPKLVDAFQLKDELNKVWIVMKSEYCTLREAMSDFGKTSRIFSVSQVGVVVKSLLRGIKHIHGRQVAHLNLRPENVLISSSGAVKICDFGAAKVVHTEDGLTDFPDGAPEYTAPEITYGHSYGQPADIFALGVTAFEMFVGSIPCGNRGVLPTL